MKKALVAFAFVFVAGLSGTLRAQAQDVDLVKFYNTTVGVIDQSAFFTAAPGHPAEKAFNDDLSDAGGRWMGYVTDFANPLKVFLADPTSRLPTVVVFVPLVAVAVRI